MSGHGIHSSQTKIKVARGRYEAMKFNIITNVFPHNF
jgi:hypothetical protein